MHRYIEQLIEDFRRQRQLVTPPHEIWEGVDPEDPVEQDDISHVEQFVYGTKQPVYLITGIDRDLLPPPDKLTDEQAATLAAEMELLLNHFSLYPDFPASFPAHLRYPMLRELWDTKHVPLSFGENHFPFSENLIRQNHDQVFQLIGGKPFKKGNFCDRPQNVHNALIH